MNGSKSQHLTDKAGGAFSPGLHTFSLLTAFATLILIVAGGLVTSRDAGDSVPDWPLAFGQVIPWQQLVGNVVFEYGHRVVAATVGLLTILLNIMLWKRESRRWVRNIGLVALLAVIAQATLGGIRVLLLEYRFPVAIIHACLAQTFFCIVVSLTVFTSRQWFEISNIKARVSDFTNSSVPNICAAATASIFIQLVLGAAFRHRIIGILPHIVGAVVVTVFLSWTVISILRTKDNHGGWLYVGTIAKGLGGLLIVQLCLGVAAYLARLSSLNDPQPLFYMVSLTVAHVAGGALTFAFTVVLLLRLHRLTKPTSEVMGMRSTPQQAIS